MTDFVPRAPSLHALGAAQLVAWGATYYAIPPLLPQIGADLAIPIPSLALAMTVGFLLQAVMSVVVAAWIGRSGARIAMVTGSIVASLALVALAVSWTGALACVALALLGTAHAALLYDPAFAAVAAQTTDPVARTRAIQVITFWGGWAALWALPAASVLSIAVGWRVTLLVLASVLAVYTIRVHAQLPVHRLAPARPRAAAPPVSRALATAFALGAFATTSLAINGLLLLAERRLSIAVASVVFALLAPVQVVGRLWFMRRNGRLARHDGALPFLLVTVAVLALLGAPHLYALAAFVLLFGAGAGLLTTVRAAVVVAHVAPEHAATQLAAYSFVTSLARAVAPAASSWLYVTAGYQITLLALAAMSAIAAALVWRATRYLAVTAGAGTTFGIGLSVRSAAIRSRRSSSFVP